MVSGGGDDVDISWLCRSLAVGIVMLGVAGDCGVLIRCICCGDDKVLGRKGERRRKLDIERRRKLDAKREGERKNGGGGSGKWWRRWLWCCHRRRGCRSSRSRRRTAKK
ncbi:hypothetical protein HanRHA438_Chr10g0454691 [Helianthus annuus]|nr:hypothetical protein HanRHA438_Chr10g0454691 [Helianthus annuus]